jgi:hypothetical protein
MVAAVRVHKVGGPEVLTYEEAGAGVLYGRAGRAGRSRGEATGQYQL